ncbi:nucleoside-diphosphate kinase [Candidatus Babeliales bacterium]|nr:nucleoside-diphosphate kinase [Candidatus Babeliales bacterium]
MSIERTYAMIKPDAVIAKNDGKIIDIIEHSGFEIIAMKKIRFSPELAESFYAVHKAKPFFGELVEFLSSGPVIAMILEKESAIQAWRDLMGATDPEKAEEGTIRKLFGTNVGINAVHGSDATETAQEECSLIFPEL